MLSYDEGLINDEEMVLLYDMNKSKNPDFPYWKYSKLDLDSLCDDECRSNFRFCKNDVFNFKETLQIPDEIECYNRTVISGIEALCIFLKRFAYLCRYGDMIPLFGRSVPELSIISNYIMDHIHMHFSRLLSDFNQPF